MKKIFYAIFLFLLGQSIFASDDLIITSNFFKTGFGGHIHLSLFKVESNQLTRGYMMNVWSPGSENSASIILREEWDITKRKAYRFTGDFNELIKRWKAQYDKKLQKKKLNFWYNNCADDALDTIAFVLKIKPGLRKFWRVTRFIIPIVNIIPTIPEHSFSNIAKILKRHPDFTKLEKEEMKNFGL